MINAIRRAAPIRAAHRSAQGGTKVRIAPFETALRAAKGNGAIDDDDGLPGKPLR